MELFAFSLFLLFVGSATVEVAYSDSATPSRARKVFLALLAQLVIVGTALSLVLSDAVATGNFLPWFMFVVGLAAMISKYVDFHKHMNKMDEMDVNTVL